MAFTSNATDAMVCGEVLYADHLPVSVGRCPIRGWQMAWYVLITVVGVAGNAFVCLVMFTSEKKIRHAPFNIYLTSLACSDLLLSLISIPCYLFSTSYYTPSSPEQASILCKTVSGYLFQFWLTCTSSYTLAAMSLERQRAICDPLSSRLNSSPRKTVAIVISIWIFALILQAPTPVGVRYSATPVIGDYCSYAWPSSAVQKAVYVFVIVGQYIVPLGLMVYSLARSLKTLRELGKMDFQQRGMFATDLNRKQWIARRRRTITTVILVAVAFFICVTPNEVMYFLVQFSDFHLLKWNSTPSQVGVMLFITNSCVNPFLYAFSSKEFRAHCKRALHKVRRQRLWRALRQRKQTTSTSSDSGNTGLL